MTIIPKTFRKRGKTTKLHERSQRYKDNTVKMICNILAVNDRTYIVQSMKLKEKKGRRTKD